MIYLTTTPINLSLPLMPRIDKKAKYDEFTIKDGKVCIGGYQVIDIWRSMANDWIWFDTKVTTKLKQPYTHYGYVIGFEKEWGSWYHSDMELPSIKKVPEAEWGKYIPVTA